MESDAKQTRGGFLWRLVSDISTGETLLKIFQWTIVCLVTFISRWWPVMPKFSVDPIGAATGAGAVFLGTLFVTGGAIRIVKSTITKLKRRLNPPALLVISHGGSRAIVSISHSGEESTWEARRRIVKTLDNLSNPDPVSRLCFIEKNGNKYQQLSMNNGESAHVVLARLFQYDYREDYVLIAPNAEQNKATRLTNEGAIVEVEFKSEASKTVVKRCFKFHRNQVGDVEIADINCDKWDTYI